jgi:hypothetical protein
VVAPAYDLGFLLRKLPNIVDADRFRMLQSGGGWFTGYHDGDLFTLATVANTPEDAACKLAIELWKQEVLK